jgi:hypothetical protein
MKNLEKVTVVADNNGNVVRQSKNPLFGFIRLEQSVQHNAPNGWMKIRRTSTLMLGSIKDLMFLGLKEGETLPGKIVTMESVKPFSDSNPDRDLKVAGDSGIVCSINGQPIYRRTLYFASDDAQNVLVAHDNSDAIKEANAGSNSSATAITANQAFDKELSEDMVNL